MSVVNKKYAIVLFSGGLDSTTTLMIAKSLNFNIIALTINYKQRHISELDASKHILNDHPDIKHIIFDVNLSKIGGSALTDSTIDVPDMSSDEIPVTYVPARNTIFLSIAAAYAERFDIADIFIGVNAIDYSGYPDCRPDYIKKFQELADLANKRGRENNPIKLWTPLLDLNKEEIIKLAFDNHVPLDKTWSCYSGNSKPCGKCDSCRIRNAAYEKWLNNNNKK